MGHTFSEFSSKKESGESGLKTEGQRTLIVGSKGDPIIVSFKVPFKNPVGRLLSRKESKASHSDDMAVRRTVVQVWTFDDLVDCGYEKSLLNDRRGSVPVVIRSSGTDTSESSNRLMSFINRTSSQIKHNLSLKRTKSATKLEAEKPDGVIVVVNGDANASTPHAIPANSLKRTMSLSRLSRRWQNRAKHSQESQVQSANNIRASQSYESLLSSLAPGSGKPVDLPLPHLKVKPQHGGVFSRESCFQTSTNNSKRLFSGPSSAERQKWMQHLQRTVQPLQEKNFRKDLSLELWVMEAKNLPPKYKYFCEIFLDSVQYAQTSSKVMENFLFWGEQFDLGNLPSFNMLTIKLFKEGGRNKRKDVNVLVGQVEIPVDKLSTRQLVDLRYPVSSQLSKECTLRLKTKYQCVDILPLVMYQPLIEYMQNEYRPLVSLLETTLVHVKEKEDMARALVHTMHSLGHAKEFIVDILIDEIDRQDNPEILLRGNSIASKAIDVYMKLVGEKYLRDTLSDFLKMVLDSPVSFEVDPKHLSNGVDLHSNRKHLLKFCQHVWFKIFNSHPSVPTEIKLIFSEIKSHLLRRTNGDVDLVRQLVSSCLFLRFLTPAIIYPSMFGLCHVLPQDKDARNLTLIAKTIQGLANFTKFGAGKEDFMVCMNEFLRLEATNVKTFLDQISTVDLAASVNASNYFVDLGREVSILHSLLQESYNSMLAKAVEEHTDRLGILGRILSDISLSKSGASPSKSQRILADAAKSGCDAVSTMPRRNPHLPPLDVKIGRYESLDSGPCGRTDTPHFVSNTAFTLTNSADSSLSSDAGNQCFDVPRSRKTMREMQDSDQYVSLMSDNPLPTLPPTTNSGNRPHAVEEASNDFSADVLAMFDSMIFDMSEPSSSSSGSLLRNQTGSSSSSSQQGTAVSHAAGNQQKPLAFSNPLFGSYQNSKSAQNHTPPIVPPDCRLSNDTGRKTVSTDKDFTERALNSAPPTVLAASPLLLGHPPVQNRPGGFLYGCHSHENLPHHRSAVPPRLAARNSAALAASDLECYFGGALSRSMEFPAPNAQHRFPDALLKRTNTDSLIVVPRGVGGVDTPPESPTCCTTGHPGGRGRNGPASSAVRMGVRSVQRKLHESEKGKLEYETELMGLRQQLADVQRRLEHERVSAVAQTKSECSRRLRQTEQQFLVELADRDRAIGDLKDRLLTAEQRNQHNESLVRDLQLQIKELMTSLGGQRSRVLMTHGQVLDDRQCSTH